ncbi:MAG: LLM class flavin-dependent oxidoreductase [Rhodospirillales bacterium]|nr:LLM class flavin-dependent oxidoreductase [Rhodospirillales bacterium]
MRLSAFSVQDHYPTRGRTVAELYRELIGQAELADELGYDSFFVAEHHFHEYGVIPNPAVMIAALAAHTKRIRLGSAVAILPFHHPLTVAENYAMADLLSGGRLVLGVGSGYLKHEFAGYAIDGAEKRERFDEALAVLKRALAGERLDFKGKFTAFDSVALNVLPVQRPTPPIYVAVLKREGAYFVGRQGHDIMCVPYASVDRFEEVGAMAAEFRKGRAEAGLAPETGDGLFAFHTHVAESDAACRREAAEAFDLYVETRLYAKRQTFDDILKSGLGLFGSVDTVVEKLVRLREMGVNHVMALMNFGLMTDDRVRRSMRLMAEEVMPRVRRRLAAGKTVPFRRQTGQ